MKTPRTPSYRLHKPSRQAVVTLNGRDIYLGVHGSAESRAEYDRLVGEWLANGRGKVVQAPPPVGATVSEVILAFWRHAEKHYRARDGRPSDELENFKVALRPLRKLYGRTPAAEFGPLALRAVRAEMVKSELARTTVNARVNRIRRVFRWAASVELVPASVFQSLETVDGLRKGRTEAREPKGIGPVPIEAVETVLPHLPRPVAAMVRLQLLTGCRAGEIMIMRDCDLTPGEPNWTYRPSEHKNDWRELERIIPIGPRAQAIVREFLRPDPEAYLFSPRDAVAEHHGARTMARRSKPTPSERARRARNGAGSKHAERYDRRSYRQAIVRACDRAFPHPTLSKIRPKKLTVEQRATLKAWRIEHRWSPLQLRHTAATLLRARYGLEAAQTVLGHARADVTQVYAERDLVKAHTIMSEIG